ncbi:MAG: carbohydrate kinase family protein [Ignavibacteria bacterium]|nr:carbohydrate kinase family protein [Ignavibacteria bacterium]
MKLAVIGEPCMDYIHRGSETTEKQFGGILYSLVSLAVISKGSATVYPVMNLGEDEFENVTGFLSKFNNIDQTFIRKTAHKTRVVNLFYKDKDSVLNVSTKKTYDREENSTQPTLPVEYEQVKNALGFLDGILVNLVSGVDITLDSLSRIRNDFGGYIHMDLHNLVMQTFPDGTRKQLPVKDWRNWVNLCNTLQMNESEISILTGDNVTEYETAEKILNDNKVRSIVVTRGRSGVSLYELSEGKVQRTDLPRIDSPKFIDSTGCGDVFAASFFFKNSLTGQQDPRSAMMFANKMASVNASLHGVEGLPQLAENQNV